MAPTFCKLLRALETLLAFDAEVCLPRWRDETERLAFDPSTAIVIAETWPAR